MGWFTATRYGAALWGRGVPVVALWCGSVHVARVAGLASLSTWDHEPLQQCKKEPQEPRVTGFPWWGWGGGSAG